MISDNYECPRCHNNFPSSNKILHDVRCTEEHPLSNNDKENFIVIKKENEENKKSDLNPVFVCDICHINMPQSEKNDHILCHNLDEREKKKEKKIKRIEEQKRIEEEIRKANEQKRKEKEIKKKKFIEQQKEIERQIQRDIRRKNTNPNPNQNNDRSDNNSNSNTNNNIVGGNIIRNIASGIKEVFSLFNNYDISLQSNNNNLNNNAHINHNNNNNNNNNNINNQNINRRINNNTNNQNINRRIINNIGNNNNVHIRHRPLNINNLNNHIHTHSRINDNLRNNINHNHHINNFRIRIKHDHGTDAQIMNQLPEAFIEDVNKLDNEKKNCVICLEDFKTGDKTIILPCIHIFHNNCIKNWLKKQNSCPICKFKISSENMHS